MFLFAQATAPQTMTDTQYWLIRVGLKHYLGTWFHQHLRYQILKFKIHNRRQNCFVCKKPVSNQDMSVEHLIPTSICIELDLYMLILDPRNFAISHKLCNITRGANINDLPQAVRTRLDHLRTSKENQELLRLK